MNERPAEPDTRLPVDDRTGAVEADDDRRQQHHRRQHGQQEGRADDVEQRASSRAWRGPEQNRVHRPANCPSSCRSAPRTLCVRNTPPDRAPECLEFDTPAESSIGTAPPRCSRTATMISWTRWRDTRSTIDSSRENIRSSRMHASRVAAVTLARVQADDIACRASSGSQVGSQRQRFGPGADDQHARQGRHAAHDEQTAPHEEQPDHQIGNGRRQQLFDVPTVGDRAQAQAGDVAPDERARRRCVRRRTAPESALAGRARRSHTSAP